MNRFWGVFQHGSSFPTAQGACEPEREVGCIVDDVNSQKKHSTEDLDFACSVSFEEPFIYWKRNKQKQLCFNKLQIWNWFNTVNQI